jgi:PAS domain S-box-containing protein
MLTFAPGLGSLDLGTAIDLRAAVDQLPLDLLLLDRDLRVTYANASAVRTAECVAGTLVGSSAFAITPLSLLHREVFAQALEGRHFHDDALRLSEPGRPTRWFDIDVQPLSGATGVVGLAVLCIETTRRVRGRTQGMGERRLLALTEHARDIITIAAMDGRLQYVSGGVRNALGWTTEERESSFIFEHVHPDDVDDFRTKYQQLVAGEIGGYTKEFRIRHKDGSYRWLESSYVSALDNPLIGGVVINSRDITERKQAEFRLAQREEVFRLAADAVDGMIFEWDLRRGVVHRSRGVLEVLGIAPEELEPSADAWRARVHPRDHAAAGRVIALALLSGRGWTQSYRIRDATGRYKSILERALIQRGPSGDPVRAIGCCVDVSEIKRLTDILAETQRAAKIGGWEYSFATRELTWTDEMFRIYDANPLEFAVSWEAMVAQCVAESRQRLRDAFSAAQVSDDPMDLQIEIITGGGERLWVRVIGHVERLDGRPLRVFGSVQNIQAQKLAQLALETTTGWLKLSMNMAHLHAWRWDRRTDSFEFANLDGQQVHLQSVYPSMAKLLSRVHPQDAAAVRQALDRALTGRGEVREEFRLQGIEGRYHSYATTARPLLDAANQPFGLVGVIQDVTARRESEQRLRRSEELLQATTANTADTLFLVDTRLQVRFINRPVNGLRVEQIIGSPVEVLLPEAARAAVPAKLKHILETGETATYEFQALEEGRLHHYENRAVLVRDAGIGTGISISMRDITERKRLEQEILDVSARERQSIGRDLHDGLGQELTGVALMLRGLATRIQSRCPEVVENVNEVVALVNQSIETARSLARGLLPVRTESGGLSFALKALATRGRDLYGLDVVFRQEVTADLRLSEADASHLYRIAQEALTNAARHGRARRVCITLEASRDAFALRIGDDGVGFSRPAPASNGLGLKIMKYRAGMIGAHFEIGANAPHGTVITVVGERLGAGQVESCRAL